MKNTAPQRSLPLPQSTPRPFTMWRMPFLATALSCCALMLSQTRSQAADSYVVLPGKAGHGMVYENKGEKVTQNADGSTTISHNMYNKGTGYGVAEVRDKNGNLVDQVVISPNKMAVGVGEVVGEMKDTIMSYGDGLSAGDPRSAEHSEKSTLQYTVPEGGTVTFTKGSNLAGTLNTLGVIFDVAGVTADANSMGKLAAKLFVMGVGMQTLEEIQKGGISKLKEVMGLIGAAAGEAGLSIGIDKAFEALVKKHAASAAGYTSIADMFRQGLAMGGNIHFAAKDWEIARKLGSDSFIAGPGGLKNAKLIPTAEQLAQMTGPTGAPNTVANQTGANSSQNGVRTADGKRSSSSSNPGSGTYVRLHSHPWYVISPPGFGTHGDDVFERDGATAPVPVPAGQVITSTNTNTYLQWGTWVDSVPGTYNTTPGTGPAYWIAGQITPAHTVPTSGTATYTGALVGTAHTHVFATDDRHTPVDVTGSFTLGADFAARTLNGSFSFTSGFMPGNTLNATGGWTPGSFEHYGDLNGAGVYDGHFNGYFFGLGAGGIGGTWNAKTQTGAPAGSEFKAYGTYQGARIP